MVEWVSTVAQVLPYIVMATPAMLTKTDTKFTAFMESCPIDTLIRRVKIPEVENNIVVLETLVRSSAAFIQYCKKTSKLIKHFCFFIGNVNFVGVSVCYNYKHTFHILLLKFTQ